jgi:hypothetical protein
MRTYMHRNMITQIAYNMQPVEEWNAGPARAGPG